MGNKVDRTEVLHTKEKHVITANIPVSEGIQYRVRLGMDTLPVSKL